MHVSFYELTTVSLPSRMVHPKGECNEEMIELLSKYSLQKEDSEEDDDWDEDDDFDDDDDWEDEEEEDDEDPIDARWSGLKNLN